MGSNKQNNYSDKYSDIEKIRYHRTKINDCLEEILRRNNRIRDLEDKRDFAVAKKEIKKR